MPMIASIEKLLEYEISVVVFDTDCARQFGKMRQSICDGKELLSIT